MTEENGQEPSMEDILASIRRILSEDEENEEAATESEQETVAEPEPKPEPKPELNVPTFDVDMTEEPEPEPEPEVPTFDVDMTEEPEPEPEPEPEVPTFDVDMTDEPEPEVPTFNVDLSDEPEPVVELTEAMIVTPEPNERDVSLLSDPVAHVSACAFAELAKTISDDRNLGLGNGNVTLEELVRQTLRPFLKEWLDANLPYLVEGIVKKEIERVVEKASRF